MPLLDHIKDHFAQSIALLQTSAHELSEAILAASQIIHQSLPVSYTHLTLPTTPYV